MRRMLLVEPEHSVLEAELTGLSKDELTATFYDNGMALISRVAQGNQLQQIREQCVDTEKRP